MTHFKTTSIGAKLFGILLALVLVIGAVPIEARAAETTAPTDAWSTYAAEKFEGGTGTKEDPYLIATEEQLAKLSVDVANDNEYKGVWFKLTNDLDLSAHRWNPIGQYKWTSTETISNDFSGNFDGNGKTIRGIYVDEVKDGFSGGLFGNISNSAANDPIAQIEIRNLTIEDALIYGNEEGLVQGYNGILSSCVSAGIDRNILVENVHVSGSLHITCTEGFYAVGGMVGYADNVTFTNCTVDDIYQYAATNSGGFVGMDGNCTYTDCLARGTVYGSWAMGGFIGYTALQAAADGSTHSTFTRCVADVDVIANDWNVGGFCGLSIGGVFTDCAALGDVSSQVAEWEPRVAGFAGRLEPDFYEYGPYPSVLTNCYFGGTVSADHPTIQPSALVASVTDNATITGCSYDKDKNPGINVFSQADGTAVTSFTATASTTEKMLNAVCDGLYGHHQYVGNTCKVCGLEQVYINADGYWVIDGVTTEVKAEGEQGTPGTNGLTPFIGENGNWWIGTTDTGIKAAGTDGADGKTPTFKIENGELKVSYDNGTTWTSLGNIQGADGSDGSDGSDGQDGTDGADGKTPTFKIENGELKVSYDNGTTWTSLGNIQGTDGSDGSDGSDGQDGSDGADGKTPTFMVENGELKVSYDNGTTWTSLGNIQGTDGSDGSDGSDGQDGSDGADGKTPTFKIENGELKVSYDNGTTWTSLGNIQGTDGSDGSDGSDGKDGADGEDGQDGTNGTDGENGLTPFIGENGNWWIGETDTGVKAAGTDGKNGKNGRNGADGADGVGISKIEKTATEGNVDTYTITLTNGNTYTFTVTNGTNGADGKDGTNGVDGKDGTNGKDGTDGKNGEDGLTPFIGENGNWWIGETDTGVKAAGTDGKDGADGIDGKDGENGKNAPAIAAATVGGVALASNIALIAWQLVKRKKSLI